jgi:hypothetical protein
VANISLRGHGGAAYSNKENLMNLNELEQKRSEEELGKEEELQELTVALRDMKAVEENAKTKRVALEEKIAALIPTKETGSKTVTLEDGTKITVKRGLIYKAELPEIEDALIQAIDDGLGVWHPPIRYKTTGELDIAGYEWYRRNQPTVFSRIAKHVTVMPRKVAVSLKAAKGG